MEMQAPRMAIGNRVQTHYAVVDTNSSLVEFAASDFFGDTDAVPIKVVPLPIIEQPDVVMMEDNERPPIWPTSQVERKGNSLQSGKENTKKVKKPKASKLPVEELDDLPHMYFSDDEPNIKYEGGVGLGGDAPLNVETEDSQDAEEGYYSNYSSVDGDVEFRDLAKECDNIFTTEEAKVHHTTLPVHNPGDRPIHKLLEKVNIMLIKLMYDRRLKSKEWEETGLVLVPRAQTHIDKMIKCYGQYQIQGIISGSFLTIGINGQRWRVNTNTHECDCHI
ncbi:hypothetical protein GIB67_039343 [Kingdonia uniflora]|uniref:Uncharacterized protein n=1 Tax=Kingdonia uniflora TaxID=39325 RepID=A0A7J7LX52_9MAGN|nr:hypothetical protein GIB67_039343 [Kingdonia uniflora]